MSPAEDGPAFCRPECQDAYRVLYDLECYLRFMLRWELVAEFGNDWKQRLGLAGEEAKERIKSEREMRVIDFADGRSILSYLLFTELKSLMLTETIWPLFKQEWSPKTTLDTTLHTLGALRNKIAHFRRLTTRDVRVLHRNVESLAELTRHYRRSRRSSRRVPLPALDELPQQFRPKIDQWHKATKKKGPWATMEIQWVGRYVRIDAALKSGAFARNVVDGLLVKGVTDAFFIAIDHGSGLVSLYVPSKLDVGSFEKLIGLVMAFRITDGFEDTQTEDEREFLDFVFPINVALPMELML